MWKEEQTGSMWVENRAWGSGRRGRGQTQEQGMGDGEGSTRALCSPGGTKRMELKRPPW